MNHCPRPVEKEHGRDEKWAAGVKKLNHCPRPAGNEHEKGEKASRKRKNEKEA